LQINRKRSGCLLNGGMAHSCDLKDVVSAVDEAKYWGSFMSPGKRRWPNTVDMTDMNPQDSTLPHEEVPSD
jgi:hypothetical protein